MQQAAIMPDTATAQPQCKACGASLVGATNRGHKDGFDFLECGQCKTVTVDPFPTVAELVAFYQSYEGTSDYRKKKDRKIARAMRRLRKLLALAKGRRFLDVGCNYGFTVEAAKRLGLEVKGIDIDATAVAASREMFGHDYEAISVEDFAARGEKADLIYTSEVIEHVHDPAGFVAAIAKILTPGGVVMITTPDAGHFRVPRTFTDWYAVMPPEHITYFTKKGLSTLLEQHGLTVVKTAFNLKPGMQVIARKTA